MATKHRVVYKNHCTPQEQIVSGGKYYLDSDCRRKLTGTGTHVLLGDPDSGTAFYNSSVSISTTPSSLLNFNAATSFVYIKNTGTDSVDLLITFDNNLYYTVLSDGEAFASFITNAANVKAKTASGTTTIEHFFTAKGTPAEW